MSKRYVFWRTPDGKIYREHDDRHAPRALLASIGENASVSEERKVQWVGFNIFRAEPALRSAVAVIGPDDEELNEYDSWHAILRPAIATVICNEGGGRPARATDVISKANEKAAEYFRRPVQNYTVVTSLSVASLPARTMRIDKFRIRSLTSRRKYAIPEVLARHQSALELSTPPEAARRLVAVDCTGRTPHAAKNSAIAAIDLLRGIWTLAATYKSWAMGFGPPRRKPLGLIRVGPTHTVHNEDGTSAENLYWHDPGYIADLKPFETDDWKRIEKVRQWAMRRLATLPYGGEIRELLIRYANALDHADYDVSLLQMWSILERVTDTIGTSYDVTIERATWGFSDRAVAKEKLQCVRLRRNQVVHSARSSEGQDQVVYLIKSFIDPHLTRLLRNDFRVDSVNDYAKFLALPSSLPALHKQLRHRRRAERILKWVEAEHARERSENA